MRKFFPLIGAAIIVATLGACDPDDQGASAPPPAAVSYDTPPVTAGDTDGPAVDRTDVPSQAPTIAPTASERAPGTNPATMTPTEAERFGAWDGTGDTPYGDDSDNDGRFSDVTCNGGTCVYGNGALAAQGIAYRSGVWYWDNTPISTPGQCANEGATSCLIVWDNATTSPVAVAP